MMVVCFGLSSFTRQAAYKAEMIRLEVQGATNGRVIIPSFCTRGHYALRGRAMTSMAGVRIFIKGRKHSSD